MAKVRERILGEVIGLEQETVIQQVGEAEGYLLREEMEDVLVHGAIRL